MFILCNLNQNCYLYIVFLNMGLYICYERESDVCVGRNMSLL
jgi:hypothetical protein